MNLFEFKFGSMPLNKATDVEGRIREVIGDIEGIYKKNSGEVNNRLGLRRILSEEHEERIAALESAHQEKLAKVNDEIAHFESLAAEAHSWLETLKQLPLEPLPKTTDEPDQVKQVVKETKGKEPKLDGSVASIPRPKRIIDAEEDAISRT